jgi:branched-chain amino acid aminotransferase
VINFNGKLIPKSEFKLDYNNRGFTYGDSIFDTSKFEHGEIQFLEDHYFRLMASMRMLRMKIPITFTQDFFKDEIIKTISKCCLTESARVKFTVFRNFGGYYTPKTDEISYLVEVNELNELVLTTPPNNTYLIDIFKDYHINSDLLSTIKTNNRIINVLSSIYTKENNLDNCLLINQNKHIVEANNANIFLIFENRIITPPISDGCIKGIMRKKVIESIHQTGLFILEEKSISPFDLQKADSLFLTNSIIGIQAITNFRKKEYNTYLVDMVKEGFDAFLDSK